MKLLIRLSIVLAVGWLAAHDFTGHTFFSIHPPFQTGSVERELFSRRMILSLDESHWGTGLSLTVFGGSSIGGKPDLAKYFLPHNRVSLFVAENSAVESESRDVAARHLNIETRFDTFRSRVTFLPEQTFTGVGLIYRQRLSTQCCGLPHWFLEVSAPLVHVRNTMGMSEEILSNGGGAVQARGLDNSPRVGSAIEAFQQSSWKFGRIPAGCKPLSKTGIADVEIKFCRNSLCEENYHMVSFIGMVVPTGNRPCGRYVFEPIVGNNGHFGFMWGSNLGMKLWCCDDQAIRIELDFATRYLASNHQIRSYDLEDKEWSRYMEIYASSDEARAAEAAGNARAGTSGINFFTTRMRVWPRFLSTVMTTFIYNKGAFVAEVGYRVFMRQAEKVDFDIPRTAALKHNAGLGFTTFARTIENDFSAVLNDTNHYAMTNERMVDLASAGHPATLSQTLFLAIGYREPCDAGWFVGVGGAFEFSGTNTVLSRATAWAKFGFEF